MPVDRDNYVVVSIWTSRKNKAIRGVNVGHISLTTPHHHISLWPGVGRLRRGIFASAQPDYVPDYFQDCIRETRSEHQKYTLRKSGYQLYLASEFPVVEHNEIHIYVDREGKLLYYLRTSGDLIQGSIDIDDNMPNRDGLLEFLTGLEDEDIAYDHNQLQTFLPGIMAVTHRRGQTHQHAHECTIEEGKLYVDITPERSMRYTVLIPSGRQVTATIDRASLEQIDPVLGVLESPLTPDGLQALAPWLNNILQITHVRRHTKEILFRPLFSMADLSEGEIACRVHTVRDPVTRTKTITYEPATAIPAFELPGYKYKAVKLKHASVRIVLFSLSIAEIEAEFARLRNGVTGWTMLGSNMFTRTFATRTTENCASIAFRCLDAGGLSEVLRSGATSQTTSVVTPDDLLRRVVATKEYEMNLYHGTPEDWIVQGAGETPLHEIRHAYLAVGQNASVNVGRLGIKPTLPTCSML